MKIRYIVALVATQITITGTLCSKSINIGKRADASRSSVINECTQLCNAAGEKFAGYDCGWLGLGDCTCYCSPK